MLLRIFFSLFICSNFVNAEKNAFISILSTDNFLLPAKIVAHRLRTLNSSIPYVILTTEDISNSTIEILNARNVTVMPIHKIDTPFLATHPGAKYAYTKIRLWSLTEFDTLFYLDLDTLPVAELSAAFKCGAFCAVFRHSDKFNAGMFVMKPNMTVYQDLLEKSAVLDSYDGGDQGFFNSYFDHLKYAPMYNDAQLDKQTYKAEVRKLSAAYNYDIGMYYLNGGRLLIEPKLIHYTMGPTKPWIWWTYPLFDLNQKWLDARIEMETAYDEQSCDQWLLIYAVVFVVAQLALRALTLYLVKDRLRVDVFAPLEYRLMPHVFVFFAAFFVFHLTPNDNMYPVPTWIFFSTLTVFFAIFWSDVYVTLRQGVSNGSVKLFTCCLVVTCLFGASWNLLSIVQSFGTRALLGLPLAAANLLFLSVIIRRSIFAHPYTCARYTPLPKECSH